MASKPIDRKLSDQEPHEKGQPLEGKYVAAQEQGMSKHRKMNQALVDLAKSRAFHKGTLREALDEILMTAGRSLEVQLVSIWLYRPDHLKMGSFGWYILDADKLYIDPYLAQLDSYEEYVASIDKLEPFNQMIAQNYPTYFHALEEGRIIAAADAHKDPRTKEWSPHYYTEFGVGAAMDAPIRLRGKMIGNICCDHVGAPRKWTHEEQGFVASITDFISLAIEGKEYKLLEGELKQQNARNQLILDTAIEGFCRINKDGVILEANPAVSRIFGLGIEELVGKNIFKMEDIFPSETMKAHLNRVYESHHDRLELEAHQKNGEYVFLEVSTNYARMGEEIFYFSFFHDITRLKLTNQALKDREKDLEEKSDSLEQMNTALRVLLKIRHDDKSDLEEKVMHNLRELIHPYLDRLKTSGLDKLQKTYLDILETNIRDIISPFARNLSHKYMNLTQTEIQVASYIKAGKSTKEISDLMNLSDKTIEVHRKNIRAKLGIQKKKVNLRTCLLSISSDEWNQGIVPAR